jgi:hypothetical protein
MRVQPPGSLQKPAPTALAAHVAACRALPLSRNFILPVTTVSPIGRGLATMRRYSSALFGVDETRKTKPMQFHIHSAELSAIRTYAVPARCPHCGDWMVAPVSSEFVEGGEIRHYWECEACGEASCTSITLTTH